MQITAARVPTMLHIFGYSKFRKMKFLESINVDFLKKVVFSLSF